MPLTLEELHVQVEKHEILLKLYTDNIGQINNKLDTLTESIEQLKPNHEDWDLVRRIGDIEAKLSKIETYKKFVFCSVVFIALCVIIPNVGYRALDLALDKMGISQEG